jgi:hypothetical protein
LQGDNGFGSVQGFTSSELLGRLGGFGLLVFGDSLGLDSLGLGVLLLVILTEEVDLVVILLLSSGLGLGRRGTGGSEGLALGQGAVLVRERGDVLVPSGDVGVFASFWGSYRGPASV